MTPAARYAAAIDALELIFAGEPAEKTLSNWARKNRYAGSKDRAGVRDIVFECLRRRNSFNLMSGLGGAKGCVGGHILDAGLALEDVFNGQGYGPAALRDEELLVERGQGAGVLDFPDWMIGDLKSAFGPQWPEQTQALCKRAPVDLRVNLSKSTPQHAMDALAQDNVLCQSITGVETGLRVTQNPRRVANSAAFQNGLVELQDAASQAIIKELPLSDGTRVLDYCAGGGGKTLAMAARAPKAKFTAYDVSAARLEPLRERAVRAGAEVTLIQHAPKEMQFDLVLVDAPCSGSGAWRRNPEGKWLLSEDRLVELVSMQQSILNESQDLVADGGALAYATCSVFEKENEAQIDIFCEKHSTFERLGSKRLSVGAPGDGFFLSILRKKQL